ncbi:MAG: hypothetical protein H7232_04200 [Aeromicrobium sp.]|nr:hypothetical protein [Burkholderiales bacterium]
MLTALVNNSGGDLKVAKDHAGHVSIETTGNYLHKSANDRHDAVLDVMNNLRGSGTGVDADTKLTQAADLVAESKIVNAKTAPPPWCHFELTTLPTQKRKQSCQFEA